MNDPQPEVTAYLAEVREDWETIGRKPVRHVPRLLAAVEAVLARHKPELSVPGLGPGGIQICAVCDDAQGPERWPCAEYQAISRELLSEGGQ